MPALGLELLLLAATAALGDKLPKDLAEHLADDLSDCSIALRKRITAFLGMIYLRLDMLALRSMRIRFGLVIVLVFFFVVLFVFFVLFVGVILTLAATGKLMTFDTERIF